MLLQFIVENFTCFEHEVVFSMVSSPANDEHPEHIIQSDVGRKPNILRAAALYGGNAHGKTKLIEALSFVREFVLNGSKVGRPIKVDPFRLDPHKEEEPSRFEVVVDYKGIEYNYGFLVDSVRVHEEWLFVRPNSREVKYFERTTDKDGNVRVEAGPSMVGRKKSEKEFVKFVAQGTRANQLFFTEAVDRNMDILKPLFKWFNDVLTIIPASARYQPLELRASKEDDFLVYISNFLDKAGTGIKKVFSVKEQLDFDKYMPNLPEEMKEDILSDIDDGGIVAFIRASGGQAFTFCKDDQGTPVLLRLKTIHEGKDGGTAEFDFEEESSGTQRLMEILPILVDVKSQEKVYVVDELDRKLHPLLTRLFVSTYLQRCEGDQRGQLIFTTHDDNLLDLNILRRDEIWFLQKNKLGSSTLHSLSDLKVRPDLKISKGYLNGRFGGIPKIIDIVPECSNS